MYAGGKSTNNPQMALVNITATKNTKDEQDIRSFIIKSIAVDIYTRPMSYSLEAHCLAEPEVYLGTARKSAQHYNFIQK